MNKSRLKAKGLPYNDEEEVEEPEEKSEEEEEEEMEIRASLPAPPPCKLNFEVSVYHFIWCWLSDVG